MDDRKDYSPHQWGFGIVMGACAACGALWFVVTILLKVSEYLT